MRKPSHPSVMHSEEEHEGREVEILMRVIRQTETATERQVWESVKIDSMTEKDPKNCLNLKSEWGLSKNPSLETKSLRPRAKPPEMGKGKRVKTGNRETDRQESPRAKRARSQSPSKTGEREGERTEDKVLVSKTGESEEERTEDKVSGTKTEKRERERTESKVTVSGANTPVRVKVKRLETQNRKETKRKNVPTSNTKMIQPTLMSFMDIRGGLKGQGRVGSQETPSKEAKDLREGQGALGSDIISPEHGEGRVRPPMRGSPEHLLLHEAKVLTKGRKVSQYRKRFEGAESMEPRQGIVKPGGKQDSEKIERKSKEKVRL